MKKKKKKNAENMYQKSFLYVLVVTWAIFQN